MGIEDASLARIGRWPNEVIEAGWTACSIVHETRYPNPGLKSLVSAIEAGEKLDKSGEIEERKAR